ncbi:hydroxymethylglutaryl-CoA synthase [Aerococcus vaginalis]
MTVVGIDKIGFYTAPYYLDMTDLAHARNEEPDKFKIGLGQEKQTVTPVTQDAVTLAANASEPILDDTDREKIDLVIFATESGVDQSKAGAIYLHHLLGIQSHARSIEVKEACYSGTYGLQAACDYIHRHPERRALVVASDVARYGLKSGGEATQGGGAVAMVVSADPRIAVVNDDAVFSSKDIMDFWRPNYRSTAVVDGHYSNEQYLAQLMDVWGAYEQRTNKALADFDALCFHLPYTKMGIKAMRELIANENVPEEDQTRLNENLEISRYYNRYVGNLYTGSLYLSLLSLLARTDTLAADDTIGMYSYGSGAMSEFFSLTLVDGFQSEIDRQGIEELLDARQKVSVAEYEELFSEERPTDGSHVTFEPHNDGDVFRLLEMEGHRPHYGKSNA